jgi:hypothetical protein
MLFHRFLIDSTFKSDTDFAALNSGPEGLNFGPGGPEFPGSAHCEVTSNGNGGPAKDAPGSSPLSSRLSVHHRCAPYDLPDWRRFCSGDQRLAPPLGHSPIHPMFHAQPVPLPKSLGHGLCNVLPFVSPLFDKLQQLILVLAKGTTSAVFVSGLSLSPRPSQWG